MIAHFPSSPVTQLQTVFPFGARDEREHQHGYAHLCEHLFFSDTTIFGNYDALLAPYGAESNAWTDHDHTSFQVWGPAGCEELFLWLESARFAHLPTELDAALIEVEKAVVLNELDEEYHSAPFGQLWLQRSQHLFGSAHPYGHPVIGDAQSISNADKKSITRFMRRGYVPGNAKLMVSGSTAPEKVVAWAERYWGDFNVAAPQRQSVAPPPSKNRDRVLVRKEDALPQFSIDWLMNKPTMKERATQVICAEALGAERYGKLIHQFELEQALTSGFIISGVHKDLCSIFSIGGAPITHSLDQTIGMLLNALNELMRSGIGPEILSQTKRNIRYQWTQMKTEPLTYSEELVLWHLLECSSPHSHQLELLESVTSADICRFLSVLSEQEPVICKGLSVRTQS